jgi:hypothetical protein
MVVYTRRRRCLHARVVQDLDPVEQVRAIWSAYGRGGFDALHEVVPGVEWIPLGHDSPPDDAGLREHASDISITVHGLEEHGSCVLAHGSLRTFRDGGFVDMQPCWVYFFDEHKRLKRCVGYATREDALAAVSAES